MFKVGITGGIGSGKSTVSAIFKLLGIPIYYADEAAKRLMQEDQTLIEQIVDLFGPRSYKEGKLDRTYIASVVFEDVQQLNRLNAIVHPATIAHAMYWMQQQTAPYAIKEAALIFESGSQDELDFVIGVYAPETLRIHRAMQRDDVDAASIKSRMKKQINENIKMRLCDAVIVNDEQQLVIPQVLILHEKLLQIANRP